MECKATLSSAMTGCLAGMVQSKRGSMFFCDKGDGLGSRVEPQGMCGFVRSIRNSVVVLKSERIVDGFLLRPGSVQRDLIG